MAHAYTPALAAEEFVVLRKERRLPIDGEILVEVGQEVGAGDTVARAELPGEVETLRASETLGVEPAGLRSRLALKEGDEVEEGTLLARSSFLFGLFKTEIRSPCPGRIEFVSDITGHLGIRRPPVPVEVRAHYPGRVVETVGREGVVIEARGSLVQGIFGVGGERRGGLIVASKGELRPEDVSTEMRGKVLVAGGRATGQALRAAEERGVEAVVASSIDASDLADFLGYEMGVAITGREKVPFTLIVTEGFGELAMSERTFSLLESIEGRQGSVSGATQVRAGAVRPEVFVPLEGGEREARGVSFELNVGSRVRVIRAPHFGQVGEVIALPEALERIETGARVRVARVRLAEGKLVTAPRANLELSG